MIDFEQMNLRLKTRERKIIKSEMKDGALFVHTVGDLTNLYEIYSEERQEAHQPRGLAANPIVFDIGAHIGVYSVKKAIQYPTGTIYSIEPEEGNFRKLQENIELNHCQNVAPLQLALFDRSGTGELSVDEFKSGQYSLLRKSKKYQRVRLLTVDDLMKELKLTSVDIMKIDTEGAEYPILVGGAQTLKRDRPYLIIETHPQIDHDCDEKIIELLKKFDYSFETVKRKVGSTIFASG